MDASWAGIFGNATRRIVLVVLYIVQDCKISINLANSLQNSIHRCSRLFFVLVCSCSFCSPRFLLVREHFCSITTNVHFCQTAFKICTKVNQSYMDMFMGQTMESFAQRPCVDSLAKSKFSKVAQLREESKYSFKFGENFECSLTKLDGMAWYTQQE